MSSKTNLKLSEKEVTVEVWYDPQYNHVFLRRVYQRSSNGTPVDIGTTSPPTYRMFWAKMCNPRNFNCVKIGSYVDENEQLAYKKPLMLPPKQMKNFYADF